MKPKIGKGSASLLNPRPIKQRRFACCGGAPFGLKAEVLNQQRRLITGTDIAKSHYQHNPVVPYPATTQKISYEALSRLAIYLPERLAAPY
jgi:hypothetical protein